MHYATKHNMQISIDITKISNQKLDITHTNKHFQIIILPIMVHLHT